MLPSPTPTRPLRAETIVDHLDRLQRTAQHLCDSHHEAEDLVQDTCVQLLERRREVRGASDLPYLLTALRNTHVTRRRSAARRPHAVALEADVADHRPALVDQLRAREVMRWIAALPERPRGAVLTVDVAGLSRADAARALGVRERRVSEGLARGRALLAARLS